MTYIFYCIVVYGNNDVYIFILHRRDETMAYIASLCMKQWRRFTAMSQLLFKLSPEVVNTFS